MFFRSWELKFTLTFNTISRDNRNEVKELHRARLVLVVPKKGWGFLTFYLLLKTINRERRANVRAVWSLFITISTEHILSPSNIHFRIYNRLKEFVYYSTINTNIYI